MKKYLREQWAKPVVRAACAVAAGALLSALCEFAPAAFQVPCHAAAQVVKALGVP